MIAMPYCMCKENFDYCKCDQHICPKHKSKITKRPVPNYNMNGTNADFSFSTAFTSETIPLSNVTTTGFI